MYCLLKRFEKCISHEAGKGRRVFAAVLTAGMILFALFSDQCVFAEDMEAAAVNIHDGEYSVEVSLTGGSGKAFVSSPTWMEVKDGKAYAKLVWSSPYYDYMIVGGKKYLNETKDGGNSTFTIPITAFDSAIPVVADTTAMGHPVAIDYTLTFHSDTIDDKGMVPQEAAKKVLLRAAIIIVIGAVLNFFVQKRRG